MGNRSTVTEFILLGLTNDPALQAPIFIVFLSVYMFTLLGNFIILFVVGCSTLVQTPMYFFLSQLSLLDLSFSTVLSPKMLVDLLTEKKTISFNGCIAQVYFFSACAGTECFLLAVMAFDRYAAICNPLLYSLTMTKKRCICLVVGSYMGGFLHSLIHAGCIFRLSFCGPNVMNHFACDFPVIMKLSCNDILINELVRFVLSAFVVSSSLFVIFFSYTNILIAILKIRTTAGRYRAASTCTSHFTCVFLFYGSSFFMEILPNSSSSEDQYKVVCVIPTVIIPALNPLIYSLRNNDIKEAFRKILHHTNYPQ